MAPLTSCHSIETTPPAQGSQYKNGQNGHSTKRTEWGLPCVVASRSTNPPRTCRSVGICRSAAFPGAFYLPSRSGFFFLMSFSHISINSCISFLFQLSREKAHLFPTRIISRAFTRL